MEAAAVIGLLGLRPHPEGGHYRETFRDGPGGDDPGPEGRGAVTAIYYLLAAGEVSHWHRIDAIEIWHWYAGAPLVLEIAQPERETTATRLGPDLAAGERPQAVVPAECWQSARSLGAWSLMGCTVSPAFQFEGFEMAAPGWTPESL